MPNKIRKPQAARRGRPHKYGRPSQVVAVTLPKEVIKILRRQHADLGWAIVQLVEKTKRAEQKRRGQIDAELVQVGEGLSLIVVPVDAFRSLPNVQLVPLSSDQAFLALEPGHGLADLEVAAMDRLDLKTAPAAERRAIARLRRQLRTWRLTPRFKFHLRTIILVEHRR